MREELQAMKFLYYLFPVAVSWLCLSLMNAHLSYYDIGVNAAANRGFLLLFVAPILVPVLLFTAELTRRVALRLGMQAPLSSGLGALLVLLVGMGVFLGHCQYYADYPSERPRDTSAFLNYFLRGSDGDTSGAPPTHAP